MISNIEILVIEIYSKEVKNKTQPHIYELKSQNLYLKILQITKTIIKFTPKSLLKSSTDY